MKAVAGAIGANCWLFNSAIAACMGMALYLALRPPPPVNTADIIAEGGKFVKLPDGRVLEYFTAGDPKGTPFVYFLGYGNTGRRILAAHELLEERGIRGIAITVPGFGRSSLAPNRRMTDWPRDVDHVLVKENVLEFYVGGFSFGGQHAAAVAQAMPRRVLGLLMIAPVAPVDIPFSVNSTSLITDTLRFLMSYPVIGELVSAAITIAPVEERLEALPCYARGLKRLANGTAGQRTLYSAIMEDHHRGPVLSHHGFGPANIRLMTIHPWGFNLSDLGRLPAEGKPVRIISSIDDVVNPLAWHQWMKEQIPGAQLDIYSGWGHAIGEVGLGRILDEFIPRLAEQQTQTNEDGTPVN